MLMYDFEFVYVPGHEMGITDYLSRSPHTREAKDKSLTKVITICLLKSRNEIKYKLLTKAVIDSFPKPFHPKIRRGKTKISEKWKKQTIAKLSESTKAEENFRPIRFAQKVSRAIKSNRCGKNEQRERIMNDLNALNSLVVKPKQSRFRKVLTSKIDNIPLSKYANSILPLHLANFHITDHSKIGKMSKRSRMILESSDEEENSVFVKHQGER